MALLTVAYIGLTFIDEEHIVPIPDFYLWVFPSIFVGEFVIRLADSTDRRKYLRTHWIDAVTAIPLLGALRVLRLLRLLRLVGIIRLVSTIGRATDHGGHRDSLWFVGPLLALIWVGSAYSLWVVERPANPHMQGFADALYMSFGAATTFGYANVQPVTGEGRVIAGLLIFVGIGLVTFASSQLTAKLVHSVDPATIITQDFGVIHTRLDKIGEQLDILAARLGPRSLAAINQRPAIRHQGDRNSCARVEVARHRRRQPQAHPGPKVHPGNGRTQCQHHHQQNGSQGRGFGRDGAESRLQARSAGSTRDRMFILCARVAACRKWRPRRRVTYPIIPPKSSRMWIVRMSRSGGVARRMSWSQH